MSEETFRCPECDPAQNRSRKLYVNMEKGMFNCFRCGYHGPISRLHEEYPKLVAGMEDSAILAEYLKVKQFNPFTASEQTKDILSAINPVYQIEAGDGHYKYLQSRGWSEYMISIYGPLKSLKAAYLSYVIIPIYKDKNILFYVGRDITDNADRKYKNSSAPKTNVLFKSEISESVLYPDDLFLAEGIFDVAKLPSGVALLGKQLSKGQEMALFNLLKHKKNVYICLDADAKKDVTDLYNTLSLWFPAITFYTLEYPLTAEKTDLGKMSEIYTPIQLASWIQAHSRKLLKYNPMEKLKERFNLSVGIK